MNVPPYTYREGDRKAFIDALRELANFLVLHQAVPVPSFPSLTVFAVADTDDARRMAVARVARLLDVRLSEDGEVFQAVRRFGPIAYRAWASTLGGDAAYDARRSYDDAIHQ